MTPIEIKKYVDGLFKANRKLDVARLPITEEWYAPKEDNIRPMKKYVCAALEAREWFYENGPPDVQPLPLSDAERERLKSGGVKHILAWYARSLSGLKYNVKEHPSFDDYACGVMASQYTPYFVKNNPELQRRFPARPLDRLDSGLWRHPPKRNVKGKTNNRRTAPEAA
jgi:hypothetical protein